MFETYRLHSVLEIVVQSCGVITSVPSKKIVH